MFIIYVKTNTGFEKAQWCEAGWTLNLLNLHQFFMYVEEVNSCDCTSLPLASVRLLKMLPVWTKGVDPSKINKGLREALCLSVSRGRPWACGAWPPNHGPPHLPFVPAAPENGCQAWGLSETQTPQLPWAVGIFPSGWLLIPHGQNVPCGRPGPLWNLSSATHGCFLFCILSLSHINSVPGESEWSGAPEPHSGDNTLKQHSILSFTVWLAEIMSYLLGH